MKEQQIHGAFMLWLKKQGLFYIHATFGKKSTMTKDWPDFTIIHCNRALLIEFKTEHGKLTAGQKEMFAKLQSDSGMVVHIARSVEQAVTAVETWLGVVGAVQGETVREKQPVRTIQANGANLFIGNMGGKDYVFSGTGAAGETVNMVRMATAADLINIQRRPNG